MKVVLRVVLGLIFIVSGLVKAVDAKGFSFKLEEYFSPSVFNILWLEAQALPLALIVIVLELLLGIMLVLRLRLKFTLAALIALCIFFAFLTFYSAYFNKVTDCGCFGDALKLTPWQSFFKDIILLAGLLLTWFLYRDEFHLLRKKTSGKYIVFSIFMVASAFIIYYGLRHEPLIDFRDYKIGTDMNAEKAALQKNPSEYKVVYSMINTKTGEKLEVDQDEFVNEKKYWEDGTPWITEENKTTSRLIKQGYASEISKFKPETPEGVDRTSEILAAPKAILLFTYNPAAADKALLEALENKLKQNKNVLVVGVSTRPDTFKQIDNTMMDGTAIKTIARSNPFVLTLQNGRILDKRSGRDYLAQ